MRILNKFLLLYFLFIFSILSVYAQKPQWINDRPVKKDYYIGIAGVSKKNNEHYTKKAKSLALEDLASEISIRIESNLLHKMIENSNEYKDEFIASIHTATTAHLEDYEIVDTWENDQEYWVYYKLSKEKYSRKREENKKKALSKAYNLYVKALEKEKNKEITPALVLYLKALHALQLYLNEPLKMSINNKEIYLANEILSSLQISLGNINFQSLNKTLKAKTNLKINLPLKTKTSYKETTLISNLPIKYTFIKGKGELVKTAQTNPSGIAKSIITQFQSSDKIQIVKAELSSENLIPGSSPILSNLINSLAVPETRYIIKVSGPSVNIVSKEFNIDKKMDIKYLEPALKDFLAGKNYSFTEKMENADIYLEIHSKTRKGSQIIEGMYSSFLDVTVSITNLLSGKETRKIQMNDIKGINLDYKKAGLKAYEKASEKLIEKIDPLL